MESEIPRRELRADTRSLIEQVVSVLEDKKAEDIVALEVGAVSSLADVFIVASGTSERHLQTLQDAVQQELKVSGQQAFGSEGQGTGWCLIDYGDVVVHLFDHETRGYYDLERLWVQPDVSG